MRKPAVSFTTAEQNVMSDYLTIKEANELPRLPLEGSLDLTCRCNNNCLHCWLREPPHASEQHDELTFDEIRRIADEARTLGTQRWNISGGEPMLRPDFPEIFDYLTHRARGYSLNTNGTLITPEIAKLLTRKGAKMIALYGATEEVYDAVTRNPGGFEAVMRGLAYLREAGAGVHRAVDPHARQLAPVGPDGGAGPIALAALARRGILAVSVCQGIASKETPDRRAASAPRCRNRTGQARPGIRGTDGKKRRCAA